MISEYDSAERLSNTGMGHLKRSPLHYRYWRDNVRANDPMSPALVTGIAVHMAILEPDRFANTYESMPDVSHLTPGQKAGVTKAMRNISPGDKTLIAYDHYQEILGMQRAVLSHEFASKLLLCEREVCHFWHDVKTGAPCKGRFDSVNWGEGFIADLKTTENASEDAFRGSIYKYSLYRQAAFYMSADEDIINFYWVAVEKKPPYGVAIYSMNRLSRFFEMGGNECNNMCEIYADCLSSGSWPGYGAYARSIDDRQQLATDSDWLG